MGRHHRVPLHPRGRTLARSVPAVLSAAVLASLGVAGTAQAADAGSGSGSTSTAGALDPAGSALGTATGTDEEPATSSSSRSSGTATAVTLAAKNGSGVSGRATITEDDVIATASGLDPTARYVSFFYGATSSASNNNPCILDGTNPLPKDQTIGTWKVRPDGTGTLSAANPLGARYRLQAGTMSIRKVTHGFSKATALPVQPLSYSLVACGAVQRTTALDPVTDGVPQLPKLPSGLSPGS